MPWSSLRLPNTIVKGFVVKDQHLEYVVGLSVITNKVNVIKMNANYIDNVRSPNNSFWLYSINNAVEIKHDGILSDEVYVSSEAFTDSNGYVGYRIFICGTSITSANNRTFAAVFNTAYNITEGMFESDGVYNERCVAMHSDLSNNIAIVLSEVYTNKFYNTTAYDKGSDPLTSNWNIGVRAFIYNGFLLHWWKLVGSDAFNDSYAGSGVLCSSLYIATNAQLTTYSSVSLYSIFTTSGISSSFAYSNISFRSNSNTIAYDIKTTYKGIFILMHKGENLTYTKKLGTVYKLKNKNSTNQDIAIVALDRQLNILDVASIATENTITYYPKRLVLYESSGYYNFILLAQVAPKTGLLFYTLSETNTSYSSVFQIANCSNAGTCYTGNYYITCNSGYRQDFSCVSACSSGYYLNDIECLPCHHSCSQCTGPTKFECQTCSSIRILQNAGKKGLCICPTGFIEYSEVCQPECDVSAPNKYASICFPNCPSYSIPDYTNIEISSSDPYAPSVSGYFKLAFNKAYGGIKLPGPANFSLSSLPYQYTISFWAYSSEALDAILVNAFNGIIFKLYSDYSLGVSIQCSSAIPVYSSTPVFELNKWIYVHFYIDYVAPDYIAKLYILKAGSTVPLLVSTNISAPPDYFFNYFILGSDINNTNQTIASLSFSGYIAELKFILKGIGADHIVSEATRAYYSYSYNNPNLVAYWHLDYIYIKGASTYIKDSSMYQMNTTISFPTTLYPQMQQVTTGTSPLGMAFTNDVAQCVDVFESSRRVSTVMGINNIIQNRLQYRLNEGVDPILSLGKNIITGHYIEFKENNCSSSSIVSAKVFSNATTIYLSSVDFVTPLTPYLGKYIAVCISIGKYYMIDNLYLPQPFDIIYNAYQSSILYRTFDTYNFSLIGGEQSGYDHAALVGADDEIIDKITSGYMIDEEDILSIIIPRSSDGYYYINYTSLIPGKYMLLWESASARTYTVQGKHEYKVLNTYWSYQTPPTVKLENMDSRKTSQLVQFKSEYITISLDGLAQNDGDIIAIINGGCNIQRNNAPLYIRINEEFPQIWFGSNDNTKGVMLNLSSSAVSSRFSICWVPSATLKIKEIDDMEPLYNFYAQDTKARYELTQVATSAYLPEIYMINPTPANPILLENTEIKFGGIGKFRPNANGRIDIVELLYSDPEHSNYVENTKISIIFDTTYCSGSANYIKYLYWGDYYSLKGLPPDTFTAGSTYKLIIYSNSFRCCGDDTICSNNMLFGAQTTQTPIFQFKFRYQDFSQQNTVYSISIKNRSLTIASNAFQVIPINGSNGFNELLYFIGLSMTLTNCNNQTLVYTHPTQYSYQMNSITIKSIDLSLCKPNVNILANLKFYKVLTSINSAKWASSMYYNISIGKFSCHSDCLECNGPLSTNCIKCNVTSEHKYYLNNECLTVCPMTSPYVLEDYNKYESIMEGLTCLLQCPIGYFPTLYPYAKCEVCNSLCKSCSSNDVMSCLSCNDYNITDVVYGVKRNSITAPYLFKGICLSSCPFQGTVLTQLQNKSCVYMANVIATMPSVQINVLGSKQRVNKRAGAKLKSVILNDNSNLGVMKWSAYPQEDETTLAKTVNCDSCYFYSYSGLYLYQQSIRINASAFNRTASELPIKIISKAYNKYNSNFTFDMVELFPDSPPPIGNLKDIIISLVSPDVTIDQKYSIISVGSKFSVLIKDGSDSSEWPMTYMKVVFEQIAFYNGSVLSTTPNDFYISPINIITLSPYRQFSEGLLSYTIKDLEFPPMMSEPVVISNKTMIGIRGKLRIYAENEYFSASDNYIEVIVVEKYDGNNKESTLQTLSLTQLNTWDDVLHVANSFRVINKPLRSNATSMRLCYSSDECGFGVCVDSVCKCEDLYYGQNCQWKGNELYYSSVIGANIIDYIRVSILNDIGLTLDHKSIEPLCISILSILTNAETVSESYISTLLSMSDSIVSLQSTFIELLSPYQINLVVQALSSIAEYVLYKYQIQFTNIQYQLYSQWDTTLYASEDQIKDSFAKDFTKAKNNIYKMLDNIAISVFSTDAGYTITTNIFCAFVTSDSYETLISKSIKANDDISLKCPSSSGFVVLPISVWDQVSGKSDKKEIKFRYLEWFRNPYFHSKFYQYIDSSIISLALFDISGKPLPLNTNLGLVYVLPRAHNKGADMPQIPRCVRMSNSNPTYLTQSITQVVNVNKLNLTDEQKKLKYPQWNPNLYSKADLIVEETTFSNYTISYGDFSMSANDSFIPSMLSSDGTYFCSISEFAEVGVAYYTFPEARLSDKSQIISTDFSLLANWNRCIGFYALIAMGIAGSSLIALAVIIDKKKLPEYIKEIEGRRVKLAENTILTGKPKKHKKIDSQLKKKGVKIDSVTDESQSQHDSEVKDISDVKDITKEEEDQEAEEEITSKNSKPKVKDYETNIVIKQVSNDTKENSTKENNTTKNDVSLSTESKINSFDMLEKKQSISDSDSDSSISIFSPDYQKKKIAKSVEFKAALLNNYLPYNIVKVTSITFSRLTRAILFISQVLLYMFWNAVLISLSSNQINQPDEIVKVYSLKVSFIWIPFLSPVLSEFVMYMYSGLCYVSGFRVFQSRNILTMRNQLYMHY